MRQTFSLVISSILGLASAITNKEFCIVGGGPSSIQLGHYFHTAGWDFVTFEKRSSPGNFFRRLPIHRSLISINKRLPKEADAWRDLSKDFRLRHDWNSLLDQDNVTLVGDRTKEIWPEADIVSDYLEDFAQAHLHKIQVNTTVTYVEKDPAGGFKLKTDTKGDYHCDNLIMAHGIGKPVTPSWPGKHLVTPYHELPLSNISGGGHWAEGLRVAVMGSGNAAFEVTKSIEDHAPESVIFTRTKPKQKKTELRFAYKTHYVGDVRIKVSDLVERHQFSSGDGMIQFTNGKYAVFKCYDALCLVISEPITDCEGRENAERKTFEVPKDGSLGAAIVKSKIKESLPAFGLIDAGSVAEKLGIKEGDCIATINGQSVLGKKPTEWGPKPWKVEVLRTGDHWIPTAQSVNHESAQQHVNRLKAKGVKDSEMRVQETPALAVKLPKHLEKENAIRKRRLGISEASVGKYGEHDKIITVHVKYSIINASQEIANEVADIRSETVDDSMRIPFDTIVTCFGWKMDRSMFAPDIMPKMDALDKRPHISNYFESSNVKGLYFLGALMHFVDFRKSAGGFIHGFRYLARLMFRRFNKAKGVPFPHVTMHFSKKDMAKGCPALHDHLLKRWAHASGPYQMYSHLGDGMVFKPQADGTVKIDYYEEIGIKVFREIHQNETFMTWRFRYGDDHHGNRVLHASVPPSGYFAENSAFLHPVLEFHTPNQKNASNPDIARHYVREDIPQQYNSTNHRYYLNGFLKLVVFDHFQPVKQEL